MVVVTSGLNTVKGYALDFFDTYNYLAFGTGTTTAAPGQTTLISETVRKLVESATKNSGAGTYDFVVELSLSEGAGSTLAEIGLFNASTGGTMAIRKLLPVTVAKTSSFKLRANLRITVSVTNV